MFTAELELCRLRPDEQVAIYSEGGAHADYAAAFAAAAAALGANPVRIDLPYAAGRGAEEIGARATNGLATSEVAFEALKRCDLVIDLSFLLFTRELDLLKESGTRVLTCTAPADALRRLFPTADIRRRAREAEQLLETAKVFHLTSHAGSDVRFEFGQFHAYCQYGMADEPGRWDNFSSAMAVNNPNDGGTAGVLVLTPGDVLYPWRREVGDRVEIVIDNGLITAIRGGETATLLRDYMAKFDDERAYAIGHIGWGVNENAIWDAESELDPRSYYGSVMFSTGPNVEFGGDNDTLCHIDVPMRGSSVSVDGETIIEDGRMVKPSLVASAA
jgi:2,5-dihydroxypyridine 5,6-dioxygenase